MLFTNHETRITAFVLARHGAAMARHGRHGRPEPLLLCSRLFAIVQQKILRLSQYPLSVHTGNAACKVFTNHGTEDKNHGLYAFYQTRDTNHGICRPFPASLSNISYHFPVFPGKKIASAKHESRLLCFSRNTNHGLYCRLITTFYRIITGQYPTIPRNSLEFFGYPTSRCPRAVRRSRSVSRCAPSAAASALRARSAAANTE